MSQQDTQTIEETTVSAPTSQQVVKRTKVVTPQKDYQTKKAIFRTYQVIWYILGVIEVVLAFRILLKLLGANAQSGFTSFIYAISNPFALPFAGILRITGISEMILEWSTLIAMAVYAIVAYGVIEFFQLVKPTNEEEVKQTVDN